MDPETLGYSESGDGDGEVARPVPGLLLIFGDRRPAAVCIPLVDGAVELGREHPAFAEHPDPRISRRHVRVRLERDQWTLTDLGSRNGALVDGELVAPGATARFSRLLRVGDSLLLALRDLGPMRRFGVRVADGRVEGPRSQATLQWVRQVAQFGSTLHITGESGAGKEELARAFHAGGPTPRGPLQTVNCAAIPEGLAERLLFGARRGAYSGADADADGYVQAAHGGVLFLDEVAELSLAVQAKLLRTLETGEVLQLGASRPRKVELRFCSATHSDLRAQVTAGRFREDLFYRITAPTITAPPLRDRLEEIPWLVHAEVERTSPGRAMHVSFVAACLLRPWPGNVRELLREARSAAQLAAVGESPRIEARHLGANAGAALSREPAPTLAPTRVQTPDPTPAVPMKPPPEPGKPPPSVAQPPSRARLVAVLRRCEGNISAAARELEVHRTQFKRWLDRHGIDTASFVPPAIKSERAD